MKLTVICDDRAGMLKELTAIISDDGTNIRGMDSKQLEDGITAVVEFVVETVDVRHLNKLVQNMRRVPGVRDVQRVAEDLTASEPLAMGLAGISSCMYRRHQDEDLFQPI